MAQSMLQPLLWIFLAAYISLLPCASCKLLKNGVNNLDNDSYQDMAASMVPQQCSDAMAGLESLTESTTPRDVKHIRQPLLKCRDLLDIFVFAYPENVIIHAGTRDEQDVDVWKMFRKDIKRLYHNLGKYHDLKAMHVPYTRKSEWRRLKRALDAKEILISNAERYDYLKFAASPADRISAREDTKLSRLYWNLEGSDGVHPRDDLDGLGNIALLTGAMLNRITDYYDDFMSLEYIWRREIHDQFHSMRKLIRSTKRVIELVPLVVSDYRPVAMTISLLDETYGRFGDLNDIIESYRWYKRHGRHHKMRKLEIEVSEEWAELKAWVREKHVPATFDWLSLHLHGAPYDMGDVSLSDFTEVPSGVLYSTTWPMASLDSLAAAMTAAWLFNGTAVCAGQVDRTAKKFLKDNHLQPLPSLGSAYHKGRTVGLIGHSETGDVAPEVRSHMDDVAVIIDNHFPKTDSLDGSAMAQFVLFRHLGSTSAVLADMAVQNTRRRLPPYLANMLLAGILTATNNLTSAIATNEDFNALRPLLAMVGDAGLDPTLEDMCLKRRCGTAPAMPGMAHEEDGDMDNCDRSCLNAQLHKIFVASHGNVASDFNAPGGNDGGDVQIRHESLDVNDDVARQNDYVEPPQVVEISAESQWGLPIKAKANMLQPKHQQADGRLVLEKNDNI